MRPVLCLLGPTATGKTDIAIELAKRFPFEIISVDSALIYKGMDIGTAKPSQKELEETPHHLVDICDPAKSYSAADFVNDTTQLCHSIYEKNKIPLLVGGSMMYFWALQNGMAEMPAQDSAVREKINDLAETKGWDFLYESLKQSDPKLAARLNPNDKQRIQRALEIIELTGKSPTQLHDASSTQSKFSFFNIAINVNDRAILHDRIAKRLDLMFRRGFVDEVKSLYDRGDLNLNLPSMRAVGYRQVFEALQGDSPMDEMQFKALVATRQFAKRQITWLRKFKDNDMIDYECFTDTDQYLNSLIQVIQNKYEF